MSPATTRVSVGPFITPHTPRFAREPSAPCTAPVIPSGLPREAMTCPKPSATSSSEPVSPPHTERGWKRTSRYVAPSITTTSRSCFTLEPNPMLPPPFDPPGASPHSSGATSLSPSAFEAPLSLSPLPTTRPSGRLVSECIPRSLDCARG